MSLPPGSAMHQSSMHERFARIDTAPLDALVRIRTELDTLDARLQAMEARKDSVAAAVYARVRADYEQRRQALEHEAAPLKSAARASYAAVRQLLQQAQAEHEAAQLDREETEFRFSLGEFDAAEHARRCGDVDARLADKAGAREQAEALRERFVAAFASVEELEQTPADAPTVQLRTLDPHATQPGATLPPPPPASTAADTVVMKTLPRAAADATQVMRVLKRDGSVPRSDQTLIMRTARLLPQDADAGLPPVVIALKPMLIGSGSDCDVKIASARAHHAEIRASMAGFTITDHGGGVRINGVDVEQHLLRQDDVIDVAGVAFVFRET